MATTVTARLDGTITTLTIDCCCIVWGRCSFLFNSLADSEMHKVILAMEARQVAKGEKVIEQGHEGENLYLVQSGEFTAYVNGKVTKEGHHASVCVCKQHRLVY